MYVYMGLPCQPGVWCVSRVLGVLYAQLSHAQRHTSLSRAGDVASDWPGGPVRPAQ